MRGVEEKTFVVYGVSECTVFHRSAYGVYCIDVDTLAADRPIIYTYIHDGW